MTRILRNSVVQAFVVLVVVVAMFLASAVGASAASWSTSPEVRPEVEQYVAYTADCVGRDWYNAGKLWFAHPVEFRQHPVFQAAYENMTPGCTAKFDLLTGIVDATWDETTEDHWAEIRSQGEWLSDSTADMGKRQAWANIRLGASLALVFEGWDYEGEWPGNE